MLFVLGAVNDQFLNYLYRFSVMTAEYHATEIK